MFLNIAIWIDSSLIINYFGKENLDETNDLKFCFYRTFLPFSWTVLISESIPESRNQQFSIPKFRYWNLIPELKSLVFHWVSAMRIQRLFPRHISIKKLTIKREIKCFNFGHYKNSVNFSLNCTKLKFSAKKSGRSRWKLLRWTP